MKTKLLILIAVLFIIWFSLASALTISSVSTSPVQIEPGQNAEITLGIKNNLEEDVTKISISLDLEELPFAPYQTGTERSFDEIREGKTKTLYFNVVALADAELRTYKIPVIILYTDADEKEAKKTSYIGLIVNSKPTLKIDYEGNLIKGKNNDLTIKIVNSGLGEVKLLSLEIENTIGLKILSPKYVYIGNIDKDDFDSADFKIFVSENAGAINLPVKLNYKDALNKEYEENIQIALKTYSEKEAVSLGLIKKSNTSAYVIGIAVFLVLYFIYRRIKKARKKKQQASLAV